MGTSLTITAEADQRSGAIRAIEAGIIAIERIDNRLSTWKHNSELSRFNHSPFGSWTPISKKLATDLREAILWSEQTDQAFHPALGPLIELWDLRGSGRLPNDKEILITLRKISLSQVLLEDERGWRPNADFAFEEGGFAKGRALRAAGQAILKAGASCVRFDFGGQLYRAGACTPTTISLADPTLRHHTIADVSHHWRSSATSGLSQRHFTVESTTFGHILNPQTGRPLSTSMSVTAIGDDPVATDCLSTAFLVMGPERTFEWLETHPSFGAIFAIVNEDSVTLKVSSNLSHSITTFDPTMMIDFH